ncbi:hypothetical protein BE15_37230 [Sorangium cellulosum]|uniref:Uncharacterized protein n=2 Tax=Sorangium cellulosum TaxID=56 RepID=A0A150Q7K7_SORCE|nr:hypothetical protein BE15_37230 [Sorangium cellulosum]
MDFPVGTVFTADDESASQGDTTFTIASQPGIKACALTGIQGIFQSFDWNNGAVIQWPDEIDGTWKLKLSAGKKAWWACAQ